MENPIVITQCLHVPQRSAILLNSSVSFKPLSVLVSFSSLFWLMSVQLNSFVSTLWLSSASFPDDFNQKSSTIPTVHNLPCTKWKTKKVSNQLVNFVELLSAKETDVYLPELKRGCILDIGGHKRDSKWTIM